MQRPDVRDTIFHQTPVPSKPPKEKNRVELVADYDRELREDTRMPRKVRRQLVRDFSKELGKRGVK